MEDPFDKKLIFIKKRQNNYDICTRLYLNAGKPIMSKIKIDTPEMKILFGIEKYNNKYILNLGFDNLKNNEIYNFQIFLKNFLKRIKTKKDFDNNILFDIGGKEFVTIFRRGITDKNGHMRTHLKMKSKRKLKIKKEKKREEKFERTTFDEIYGDIEGDMEGEISKYPELLKNEINDEDDDDVTISESDIITKFTMMNDSNAICNVDEIKGKNCICELELSSMWMTNKKYGIICVVNKCKITN